MKKTIIKTKTEERADEQRKLFQSVIKMIAIDKAVDAFGERAVRWAITKYLKTITERNSLLKQKAVADERIADLSRKFGI
jgi:hypothetical protein